MKRRRDTRIATNNTHITIMMNTNRRTLMAKYNIRLRTSQAPMGTIASDKRQSKIRDTRRRNHTQIHKEPMTINKYEHSNNNANIDENTQTIHKT